MRTIKFRGKEARGASPMWVYGDLRSADSCIWERESCYPVCTNTIGQFTGLCDKNGKEIYEGDIVRFVFSPKLLNDIFVGAVVFCENMRWALIVGNADYGDKEYHIENAVKYGEVIGNIHDNPELMEAKDGKFN